MGFQRRLQRRALHLIDHPWQHLVILPVPEKYRRIIIRDKIRYAGTIIVPPIVAGIHKRLIRDLYL